MAVLREHGDVIEADFQQHYGVDLLDLWRGTLSPRKVAVYLRGLPGDSLTAKTLADITGPDAYWKTTDALLAIVVDELAALRWEWGYAHTDPNQRHAYRAEPPRVRGDTEVDDTPAKVPVISPRDIGAFLRGEMEDK